MSDPAVGKPGFEVWLVLSISLLASTMILIAQTGRSSDFSSWLEQATAGADYLLWPAIAVSSALEIRLHFRALRRVSQCLLFGTLGMGLVSMHSQSPERLFSQADQGMLTIQALWLGVIPLTLIALLSRPSATNDPGAPEDV